MTTSTEAEHTATPWTLAVHTVNEPEYGHGIVFSSGGCHRHVNIKYVGTLETVDMDIPKLEANARFILKAVNSHDELLAALENIAQLQRDKCERADADTLFMILDSKVEIARAAIAKAKAGSKMAAG